MKRSKSFSFLLALTLAALLLTACAGPAQPAAQSGGKGESSQETAPADAAPEPTAEPTPEPTPVPLPDFLGVHGREIYRNEFLGLEFPYAARSFTDEYLEARNAPLSGENTVTFRSSGTTDEDAKDVIREEGKRFMDADFSRALYGGGIGASLEVTLAFQMSGLTAEEEAERSKAAYDAENPYSANTVYDVRTASIGGREWIGYDAVAKYSEDYSVFCRALYYCDQNIMARLQVLITPWSGGVSYEEDGIAQVFDAITEDFAPLAEGADPIEPAPMLQMIELTAGDGDFSPLEAAGYQASARCKYCAYVSPDGTSEGAYLELTLVLEGEAADKVGFDRERQFLVNGVKMPKIDGYSGGSSTGEQRITCTLELSGTELAGAAPQEIREISIPLKIEKQLGEHSITYQAVDNCLAGFVTE